MGDARSPAEFRLVSAGQQVNLLERLITAAFSHASTESAHCPRINPELRGEP
jgi:hypothetical protein